MDQQERSKDVGNREKKNRGREDETEKRDKDQRCMAFGFDEVIIKEKEGKPPRIGCCCYV